MSLNLFLSDFRERVKKKFQVKQFGAEALANLMGVDVERYRKWEQGSMPKSESDRKKLANFFQIQSLENIPNNAHEQALCNLRKTGRSITLINNQNDETGVLNAPLPPVTNTSEPNVTYDRKEEIIELQRKLIATLERSEKHATKAMEAYDKIAKMEQEKSTDYASAETVKVLDAKVRATQEVVFSELELLLNPEIPKPKRDVVSKEILQLMANTAESKYLESDTPNTQQNKDKQRNEHQTA